VFSPSCHPTLSVDYLSERARFHHQGTRRRVSAARRTRPPAVSRQSRVTLNHIQQPVHDRQCGVQSVADFARSPRRRCHYILRRLAKTAEDVFTAIAAATANSSDEYMYPNRPLFNEAAIRSETTEFARASEYHDQRDGLAASIHNSSSDTSHVQNICTAAELVKISSTDERLTRHFVITDQTLYYFMPFAYDGGARAFISLNAITGITVSAVGSPRVTAPAASSDSSNAHSVDDLIASKPHLSSVAEYAVPIVADFLVYADIAVHSAPNTGSNETSTTLRQCVFHLSAADAVAMYVFVGVLRARVRVAAPHRALRYRVADAHETLGRDLVVVGALNGKAILKELCENSIGGGGVCSGSAERASGSSIGASMWRTATVRLCERLVKVNKFGARQPRDVLLTDLDFLVFHPARYHAARAHLPARSLRCIAVHSSAPYLRLVLKFLRGGSDW
jgi:hypothetical protein